MTPHNIFVMKLSNLGIRSTKHLASALMAFSLLSYCADASAVKANPRPMSYTQPDGTTITVVKHGDEFHHATYTEDGFMLIPNEAGALTYAVLDAQGIPTASNMVAKDITLRTSAEIAFIQGIDRQLIQEADNTMASQRLAKKYPAVQHRAIGDTPTYLFSGNPFPCTGSPRACVILVSYSDLDFSMKDPADYFDRMLNGETFTEYGALNSAREYFKFNSNNLFQPHFDVLGPVKLKSPMSFYGGNDSQGYDKNPHYMAIEACEALDETVDFSVYDHNKDGYIDNIFIFYAGYGEADTQNRPNTVWPHSMDIADLKMGEKFIFDGVELNRYACSMEIDGSYRRPDGIGTFVHEFSHVLGLPDLYNTQNGSDTTTPGQWSVLDSGPYNAEGVCPPNYSAHERYALNWMEPIVITKEGEYTIEPISLSNQAYLIPTAKTTEFFLLENRQLNDFDKSLPGHGMLAWHVDFVQQKWDQNVVNNTRTHHYVDLVCADNRKGSSSYAGDSFPGTSHKTEFSSTSTPALKGWTSTPIGIDITDITETPDGLIKFKASGPNLSSSVAGIATQGWSINGRTITSDTEAKAYNLAGTLCGTASAGRPLTLDLPGMYIISTAKGNAKVLVK